MKELIDNFSNWQEVKDKIQYDINPIEKEISEKFKNIIEALKCLKQSQSDLKEILKTNDYVWYYARLFVILPSKLKDKYEKNNDCGPRGADGMHGGRGEKESESGGSLA